MTIRVMLAVVAAASVAASVNAQVQKKEFPGVRNYSRVDATVGCGGQVDPAAMASLKSEGFVSVINLQYQFGKIPVGIRSRNQVNNLLFLQ